MVRSALLGLCWPFIVLGQHWSPFDQTLPCLTNPVAIVEAGEVLEFQ